MRKLIVIAMVVTLAIAAAGCGGTQQTEPTAIEIAPKPKVSLETPENQQVMIAGKESKFSVRLFFWH